MSYSVYGDVEHYGHGQREPLKVPSIRSNHHVSFSIVRLSWKLLSFLSWDGWLILSFIKHNSYEIVLITLSEFRVIRNLVV